MSRTYRRIVHNRPTPTCLETGGYPQAYTVPTKYFAREQLQNLETKRGHNIKASPVLGRSHFSSEHPGLTTDPYHNHKFTNGASSNGGVLIGSLDNSVSTSTSIVRLRGRKTLGSTRVIRESSRVESCEEITQKREPS